jgi:hypothetical protein
MSSKNGSITSPNYPKVYGVNMHCIYRLIGAPNERVKIDFEEFEVKGVMPRCLGDYIDVYTEVSEPYQNLLQVPFHGRYCGSDKERLPYLLISMTNILVIGFYTDQTPENEEKGFKINYSFIKDSDYTVGSTAAPGTCGQTVTSLQSGTVLSPTYPGMYPDNIFCFYKILGHPGQRIKLTFEDIDLYSGGEHCPFDYIKVYDGPTNEADVIDIFCGSLSNISLFSTSHSLHIDFVTKSGRAEATKKTYFTYDDKQVVEIQRRGFRAHFDISSSFISLDKLQGSHVRGTECDQIILSGGGTNGTISSPDYPDSYPLNVTCYYYIDGMQDKQNLEKVNVTIEHLSIPKIGERCENNGFLRAYVRGQELKPDSHDFEFCGNELPPFILSSTNPRLLLIFDSHGHRPGRGFQAKYQFITDYAIPGTPVPHEGCRFIYRSTSGKYGTFISPRHPSYYPDRTVCSYEFIGLENEQVRITFENFKVENGDGRCTKDHVRVYSINKQEKETLIGHYCGDKLPGPQMSEENSHKMRVELTTNEEGVRAGFRAKYEFVEKNTGKPCAKTELTGGGGIINSPNHPHKYFTNRTCEWYIYSRSRPKGVIMLIIEKFEMEGDPEKAGCGNTVLKIYTNNTGLPTYELCGNNQSYHGMTIISQGSLLRLKFVSSAKAVGGKGFTLSWTDLLQGPGPSTGKCNGFLCKVSGYCIASELKCNNQHNCGHRDTSDETVDCGHAHTQSGVLNIILGVVLALILIIVAVVFILHLRRKARNKNKQKLQVHYTSSDGDNEHHNPNDLGYNVKVADCKNSIAAVNGTLLLREHTEKVSIV